MTAPVEVSIVIPVYNEEGILHTSVVDLRERLLPFQLEYEIILAENGSTDRTAAVGEELSAKYPEVRLLKTSQPNYGLALRRGIENARGRYVICDEIDLCDTNFYRQALDLLQRDEADFVVGSKLIGGARDARPLFRHATSHLYTALLRLLFGFQGTDTHGLKAFRRDALLSIVNRCVVDKDVFASELVLRAARARLRVVEVPIRILEKRPPSINILRRVPAVVKNLAKLTWAIRIER